MTTSEPQSTPPIRAIAFDGDCVVAQGELGHVAVKLRRFETGRSGPPILIFDAATSAPIDLDLRGSETEVLARLTPPAPTPIPAQRGPGRPRLGVVAREITLLPRHWDWLHRQKGGASAALRRLVDAARQADSPDPTSAARETTYRFMSAMAGDRTGFEAATRALFAGNREQFEAGIAAWPNDIRDHLLTLARGAFAAPA